MCFLKAKITRINRRDTDTPNINFSEFIKQSPTAIKTVLSILLRVQVLRPRCSPTVNPYPLLE